MRKKNVKLWNHLTQQLKDFDIQAGWYENTRYSDNTPVAGIAAVQNFGAHIIQNVTDKQRAFLHYAGIHLKKDTNTLNIVIPPTHFMDNAKDRVQGQEGLEILQMELLRVLEGKQTMEQATNRLGLWLQGVVQEEIKKVNSPPLSPTTIELREKQYKTKSKKGNIGGAKRLNSTGIMFSTVQSKVSLKNGS